MKKIYMILAAMTLLTLSLNAQDGNQDAAKAARAAIKNSKEMAPKAQGKAKGKANTDMNAPAPTMNELLAGIKGMTSVMPPSSNPNGSSTSSGSMRAPLKINSDEYLVGPYTTNDFSTNGYGFPDAYGGNGQQIYIFSDMSRSDFEQYDGDEIVGFRLALAGSSSQTAYLYEFYSWPYSTNGYFENANRHTWSIPEFGGAQPVTTYDDIVITTDNGYIGFTSIIVYNGNNVVTQWVGSTNQTTTPTDWIWTGGSHFASNNDGSYFMTYGSSSGGGIITIPGSLFENCTGDIRLVITAGADSGYGSNNFEIDVNGDPKTVTNENPTFNQFTWTFSPTTSLPNYLELTCGQWHEFYLDEPIPFNVNDTIAGLYLGYRYWQWGSSSTGEFMYPVAVNPNSTNDGIVSYRIGANGTTTSTQTLTSWSYADDGNTFPSTWTVPAHYAGELGGSYYFGGSSGANIVIPASDLQGNSTVTVKVTAGKENSGSHTISVNNSQKSLTTSLVEYTWDNVNASSGVTIHVSDYYVNISKIEVIGTATTPNYVSGWWNENMNGDLAVQLIFKSTTNPTIEITPETQTISDAAAGSLTVTGTDINGNINVSVGNDWSVNPTSLGNTGGDVSVSYTGRDLSATTTVTATAANDNTVTDEATVNYVADLYIVGDFGTGWDFTNGTSMSYNNGTYTATITVNANNYILFARLLGNSNPWNTRDVFGPSSDGNWGMQGDSYGGNIDLNDDDPIYFPEGGTYRITINANDGTFTITKLSGEQTAAPVINYTVSSDGEHVTITATGDGTVTLNVPGHDPVSGEGEVSITVPCGYVSNTITVSATAQESGKDESDPTYRDITIPAGSDWVEMDGTYDNPNDLLSFLKNGEDIMMLDQFTASTLNNRHPESYIYTLREDQPGGEQKMSTPVPIPVYKTSSTMQGFYTYNQIITDTDMHLKPQVINSKMTYDVKPDGNVLYYNLYRGNVGEDYPVIDDTHRVSKLQQFEENSQFFMFESHTSGVTPRYDHVGNEIVERLDTNYVQGVEGNEISYVPVIWTLGINSARGDGKDNSYGSDIKRETLGAVEPYNIEIERSNGSAWGKWKVPGTNQEYCVYIPTITINGTVPAMTIANDKDKSTYVPFMYRAWCTYPAARAFSTDSETGSLIDLGPMPLPHLLGTEYSESTQAVITDKWDPGDGVLQCSFGGPADEYVNYDDVTFVVRLYYKKVVTEGDNTGSKLGDDPDDAEEYYIVQGEGSADDIETALREMFGAGAVPVSVTYVNAQGMQSNQPFDGLNIVITRYSDGSTTTSKIIR